MCTGRPVDFKQAMHRKNKKIFCRFLILFVVGIATLFISGCGRRLVDAEEGRLRLDGLSEGISDEEFVTYLVEEFEYVRKLIGYQGQNRWGVISSQGRIIKITLEEWAAGDQSDLGDTARYETAHSLSLLLWLASSRIHAIERVEVTWSLLDSKGTAVCFQATVIPSRLGIPWDDPRLTEVFLHTQKEDALQRLELLLRFLLEQKAEGVYVVRDTASGNILEMKRR